MPLTAGQIAEQFGNLLANYEASTITLDQFKTSYAALWTDAVTGGTSIAEIGAQFSALVGNWYANQVQFSDWMTGTDDFNSPDPDQPDLGWYPLTNHLGVEKWFPSPARMLVDFAGIKVEGTLPNVGALPPGSPVGTVYVIDGHFYIKNPTGWVDAGAFIGPQGPQGLQGDKGWAPIISLVADGARIVQRVNDWAGGAGVKPDVGKYLGPAGLVDTAAEAVNIRGPQGIQGVQGPQGETGAAGLSYTPDAMGPFSERFLYNGQAANFSYLATDNGNIYFRISGYAVWTAGVPFGRGEKGERGDTGYGGWSPVLAAVDDGARSVFQITNWLGGTGPMPDIGGYLGVTGIVENIADAKDVRGGVGPQGPQGLKGDKGDKGDQGLPFKIDQVDVIANRGTYDAEDPGFVFLASDEAKLYVRIGGAGGWSVGTNLISADQLKFRVTGILLASTQAVTLPIGIASVDDLHIFFNGVKVRSEEFGVTLVNSTTVQWESQNVTGYYEVILPGGPKGHDGQSFTPNASGPLVGRAAYDDEAEGFIYLDTTNAALYLHGPNPNEWSDPFYLVVGPQGATGDPGIFPWVKVTADANLDVQRRYHIMPAADLVLTLPAAPMADQEIWLAGDFGSFTVTLNRNGKNIEGAAQDLVLRDVDSLIILIYDSATTSWQVNGQFIYPKARRKTLAGPTYVVTAKDHGYILECTGACVLTIPALFDGFACSIAQAAAGEVSWAAGAGATLRQPDGHTKVRRQYSEVAIRQSGSGDIWVNGDTKA